MRGRVSTIDNNRVNKSVYAEELLILERIDVLVLTETHSTDFVHSRKTILLAQSGLTDHSAGIAFISRSDSRWSCTDSRVLIPGHTMLVHLYHKRSTESIWLLGVYGDASSSLPLFYSSLLLHLAVAIDSIPGWSGCFAAGDWNFVTHSEDHSPPALMLPPFRSFATLATLWTSAI